MSDDDLFSHDLTTAVVDHVAPDGALRLTIDEQGETWEVIVEQDLQVRIDGILGPRTASGRLGIAPSRLDGLAAHHLRVTRTGELRIHLHGCTLTAFPHERFEGWTLTGPGGLLIVACVGKGAAIFDPRSRGE